MEIKLYIFEYMEIYDQYNDEVRYYYISLIDKNEDDARKRAIDGFEKKKWKMKDDFEEPLRVEVCVEAEYVQFLPRGFFEITEWV